MLKAGGAALSRLKILKRLFYHKLTFKDTGLLINLISARGKYFQT
jgi:hypothetical protein